MTKKYRYVDFTVVYTFPYSIKVPQQWNQSRVHYHQAILRLCVLNKVF